MTRIRLFINTCAIGTLAASHPAYNFSADLAAAHPAYNFGTDLGAAHPAYNFGTDLGITPLALHPAYNSGNSTELGVSHPAYNFSDDLGVSNPHNTIQQGVRLADTSLRMPILILPDNPEVLKIKYPKDEGETIHTPPKIDIHDLDQDLGVLRPTAPKINIDDSCKISDIPCPKFVKKFTLIQGSVLPNTISKGGKSSSVGSRAAAAGNAVSAATDAGEAGENAQFRFGLSPDQIKLSIRSRMSFKEESDGSVYANALNTLEKTLDSTQAIRNNGKGMTFWVSGIYAQGDTDSIFGNPASTDKHYGIIAGTHYKHEPTQQIFGVAFDVGTGRSIAKTNKDQKTDSKMAQLTLYYNKMLSKNWKFNLCSSFMNEWEHHQRPFTDNTGVQQIAVSNSIDQEFASSIGVGYKQEFGRDNHLEPFFSFNYTFTKQFAHREKNVADGNAYNSTTSDQVGLQFGIKSSFGTEISNSKTFVVMPKVSYTNFAKMSKATQKNINISSGQVSMSQSGTPGRHLLSATIAVGIADHQADTTARIAYTGNVQKYRRSHEVMIDWSVKF